MFQENDKTLIFLHLPKTGGTTLRNVVEKNFEPHEILENRKYLPIDELKAMPQDQIDQIKLLVGHFGFGWHTFLKQNFSYMTFLRDPIDRVVSHYYFMRKYEKFELCQRARSLSLGDYLKSAPTNEVNNGQVRLISGYENSPCPIETSFGNCDTKMLEVAKENIRDHFSFIGLTERFDESVLMLSKLFSWSLPLYTKKKVVQDRPSLDQITKKDLKVVEEYNEMDLALYELVKKNFEQQLLSFDFGAVNLGLFRFLNKGYQISVQNSHVLRFKNLVSKFQRQSPSC